MNTALIGSFGETMAVKYMRNCGYAIFDCNFRCRMGEIDIICGNGSYLVFCEVKTRSASSIAAPMEFVDSWKQKKILASAQLYIMQSKITLQPRFDVIEVFVDYADGLLHLKNLNHIPNAF